MKALNRKSIIATALLGSMMVASSAIAGIADTPHNLSSTGTGSNFTDATTEICVFCHTPHGSSTDVTAPLWNKTEGTATFTTYSTANSSSIDGLVANVGSVSLACLSCHDGTQAMDVMINSPGSGTYGADATEKLAGLTASMVGKSWTGVAKMTGLAAVGSGGDLTNDHPIGIQYGGGGITGTGTTMKDKDFKAPSTAIVNTSRVWWVDTTGGAAGTREKSDMQLYTRSTTDNGLTTGEQPFVECASCHDPHISTTDTFLRISNANSAVCLACHTK